jgi:signal transduction histidine kinase
MTDDKDHQRKERLATDEGLRKERAKTDTELASARKSIERDADAVLEVARDRALGVLEDARKHNDAELQAVGAAQEVRDKVQAERVAEDLAVAHERTAGDERLRVEREENERALHALLALERSTTDESLRVERDYADHALMTRDDFLAMVSHDLRSLLGSAALSTALIARDARAQGDAGSNTLQSAERVQRSIARMNRLIGDLLDVVSIEAGHLNVSPQQQDPTQLVREAVEVFQPMMMAKGIRLSTSIEPGALVAKFDFERLLQVLANLLGNALKFTQRGGQVLLQVAATGSEVRFSVTDTGIGIPAAQHETIFDRFHRVQARDRRGLGLGLYISKCIVEAHGGCIWAESPEKGGAAIHFTLPRAQEELGPKQPLA